MDRALETPNRKLKYADESDAETIAQLAEIIWWKHYPAIIGEDQVRYMLERMYSLSSLQTQLKSESISFYLIEQEGEVLGFISFETRSEQEGFINKFYILPEVSNQGLGKWAFYELLKHYPEIQEIRLQVNRLNFKPINFYFSLGFKIEEVADFNIGDGYYMNDFVMLRNTPKT